MEINFKKGKKMLVTKEEKEALVKLLNDTLIDYIDSDKKWNLLYILREKIEKEINQAFIFDK